MKLNRFISTAGIMGLMLGFALPISIVAADSKSNWIIKPHLFEALTEPPCSYVSTENRKGLVQPDDKVIAWLRGAHNGGAIPLRHFLAGPHIINDTYGLFFMILKVDMWPPTKRITVTTFTVGAMGSCSFEIKRGQFGRH